MESSSLLIVLLVLPFTVAAVVIAVSSVRRRRHAGSHGPAAEPVHRFQTDTAAVQSSAVHVAPAARTVISGRERRAASRRPSR